MRPAHFILFRKDSRVHCAHLRDSLGDESSFVWEARAYARVGLAYQHNHLLGENRELLGFEVQDFGSREPQIQKWAAALENVQCDGYSLRVLLRPSANDPMPDSAAICSPTLFEDQKGDWIIVVDDESAGAETQFWSSVGFPLETEGPVHRL